MEPRFIAIPLKDSQEDEVIEISCDELPQGDEVLGILEAEEARLASWIEVALEYYRHGHIPPFVQILEAAGTRAGLDYAKVQNDQMRALDMLASHWMQCGYREKEKDKRQDFFAKATVLFNTADKINMYEWSHLTVRAWFYLFEKENRSNKLDLADQQFNYVVKSFPQNVLSLIGKAVIAFNKKDLKMSVYYFRKAIRQKHNSVADLRVGLGYCYGKMGLSEKAKVAFERALELQEDHVSAMCGLAIILLNTLEPENFTLAIQLLGRAYQLHPDHGVVLIHLANHFFFKREYDRGFQLAFHAFKNSESEVIKSEASYQLGRLRHAEGKYDSAFKYYYQAKTSNNGEHTLSFYGLGQLYIYRNQLDDAIKCFETVHERMPNNAETVKILGSLYAHVQYNEQSQVNSARQKGREYLQKYLDIVPDDIEVCIDLAQLLENTDPQKSLKLYENALELLQTIEDIGPQPEMLNNIGALHMQMKNFEKARQCFEHARDRLMQMIETQERDESERPQLLTIRYNLARCLEHLCQVIDAEQMYKDIVAECPNYTDCYLRLGCMTRDRNQIYDSSVWFKNGLQYDQTSADVWTLIGNLHMSKNEWQPAQKKFEHILGKNSKAADAYSLIALGNVWLEQLMSPSRKKEDEKKYIDRALGNYMKALKLQPRNMYAANGIGCILAYKKSWMDARDVFSQVREATSEFFDVWINIAHVYMEKEQHMPAVQMYSSAMKKFKHENDPIMLHYLAKAYYRAGMIVEAKEALEKALLESMDNILIKYNYAVVLKRAAKNVLKGVKMSSEQVNNAIDDLQFAERIFRYISKNEDMTLPCARLVSRTICGEEAQNCKDLLTQARHKLEVALAHDEEERKLREKQEREKEELKRKMVEEARKKEEEERKRQEAAKALRSTFVEMTKDILKLPEVVEEKRGKGGRRRKGDDGDEFVDDSSDEGNYNEEGGENAAERRERRKKEKAAKKASRKRKDRQESGSDGERRTEKRRRRKEEKERKAAEKLSAKQSLKIKSRAYLSSSDDSSGDEGKKRNRFDDDENDEERKKINEFEDSPPPPIIGGSDDSDEESDKEKDAKKKRKKTVLDSDDSSESDNGPVIGASSDESDKGGQSSDEGGSNSDVPNRRKKKKILSKSEEENSD